MGSGWLPPAPPPVTLLLGLPLAPRRGAGCRTQRGTKTDGRSGGDRSRRSCARGRGPPRLGPRGGAGRPAARRSSGGGRRAVVQHRSHCGGRPEDGGLPAPVAIGPSRGVHPGPPGRLRGGTPAGRCRPPMVTVPGPARRRAGERHIHSGELRPALEDLLGAGAIIAALGADLVRSPAAAAAEAAWVATRDQLVEAMHACASGRELAHAGYRADVDFAAQLDADQIVPVLVDGAFVPARPTPRPG